MDADMISAVGFDLDNTLYDQSRHFRSFCREASRWLENEAGVPHERAMRAFDDVVRRRTLAHAHLFDEVLESLGIRRKAYVRELIDRYHRHRARLVPYPGALETLESLSARHLLFLITDGESNMQRAKVDSLGIAHLFAVAVYTGDYDDERRAKSSTAPYTDACAQLGVEPGACVYVGDNPTRDFEGARRSGMRTIRVMTGPFAELVPNDCQAPDFTVNTLPDIRSALELIVRDVRSRTENAGVGGRPMGE